MNTITAAPARLFSGKKLFELKDADGLPLGFSLDRVINDLGMVVTWAEFIEAARRAGWWDYQTYHAIQHGLEDAAVPAQMRDEICTRVRLYVLKHPHPSMSSAARAA